MKRKELIVELFGFIFAGMVVFGVWQVYPPAAWVVCGAGGLATLVLWRRLRA